MKPHPNNALHSTKFVTKLQYIVALAACVLALITVSMFHRMTACPTAATMVIPDNQQPHTLLPPQTTRVGNSTYPKANGNDDDHDHQRHSVVVDPSIIRRYELDRQCDDEFRRVTAGRLPGLTPGDMERSIVYRGNHERLIKLVQKLQARQEAVTAVVCGGSITLGHGIEPVEARYSGKLRDWLNEAYPLLQVPNSGDNGKQEKRQHLVYNRGSHGADMCAMAKRLNFLKVPTVPDLFVLEFGVNDYQGQDHQMYLDEKEDVFFDGFEKLAGCAEAVVYRLLADYPNAAVIFLEFQTAKLNRRTAQLLHVGAAQHYKVPVLSYADVIAPDLYRLFELLKPHDYAIPADMDVNAILPYPHGCGRCRVEDMTDQFKPDGCWTLCDFAQQSGYYSGNCKQRPMDRLPCNVPFFAHDEVHPSGIGHRVARDLIANLIATTALQLCKDPNMTIEEHFVPTHTGWLVAGNNYQKILRAQSEFVLVKDTMSIFGEPNMLLSKYNTAGFELKLDKLFRRGWIADNPKGGESVTYEIDLPVGQCYVVILSVLKSYSTVGTFTATVTDTVQNTTTPPRTFDCIWKPRISVPSDVQITLDDADPAECTGKCTVTVTTNPEITDGRKGNLMKVISLAVRNCDKG